MAGRLVHVTQDYSRKTVRRNTLRTMIGIHRSASTCRLECRTGWFCLTQYRYIQMLRRYPNCGKTNFGENNFDDGCICEGRGGRKARRGTPWAHIAPTSCPTKPGRQRRPCAPPATRTFAGKPAKCWNSQGDVSFPLHRQTATTSA